MLSTYTWHPFEALTSRRHTLWDARLLTPVATFSAQLAAASAALPAVRTAGSTRNSGESQAAVELVRPRPLRRRHPPADLANVTSSVRTTIMPFVGRSPLCPP